MRATAKNNSWNFRKEKLSKNKDSIELIVSSEYGQFECISTKVTKKMVELIGRILAFRLLLFHLSLK